MSPRERGGFALFLAILAVVMVGALIIAVHVSVTLEHNIADGAVYRQRAFAAAEHALWSEVASWDSSHEALDRGGTVRRLVLAGADSANLTIVRLDESHYWLAASSAAGPAPHAAVRRSGMTVLLARDSLGGRTVRPLGRYGWVALR